MSESPELDTAPADIRANLIEFERLLVEALDSRLLVLQGLGLIDKQGDTKPEVLTRTRSHWDALTLIHIFGLLEGHIEAMGQGMHDVVVIAHEQQRKELARRMREHNRDLRHAGVAGPAIASLSRFGRDAFEQLLPGLPRRRLARDEPAADRWEDALTRCHLGPPANRPLPDDLRDTLNELGEIRNVLLHRLGKVDQKVLARISEGPWRQPEEQVVIDHAMYRRYIAALFAFAFEVRDRLALRLGVAPRHDIERWREAVPAGG